MDELLPEVVWLLNICYKQKQVLQTQITLGVYMLFFTIWVQTHTQFRKVNVLHSSFWSIMLQLGLLKQTIYLLQKDPTKVSVVPVKQQLFLILHLLIHQRSQMSMHISFHQMKTLSYYILGTTYRRLSETSIIIIIYQFTI